MKLVTAIIQPYQLENVAHAIEAAGIRGITISEASGSGRQKGHTEVYRGAEYRVDYVPKVRVEVLCREADVEAVIEAVTASARTGQIGDGKIWVQAVEQVVRVRTGESGEAAI